MARCICRLHFGPSVDTLLHMHMSRGVWRQRILQMREFLEHAPLICNQRRVHPWDLHRAHALVRIRDCERYYRARHVASYESVCDGLWRHRRIIDAQNNFALFD